MRSMLAGVASIALLASAGAASACGDTRIIPHWTLDHREFSGDAGLPFLSPGNDSRVNLQFLMMDAHPDLLSKPGEIVANPNIDFYAPAVFERSGLDLPRDPAVPAATAKKLTVFASGEGSRCLSFESGKQAFLEAVQSELGLSAAERSLLAVARDKMTPSCLADVAESSLPDPFAGAAPPSAAARDFANYLAGAMAFYEGAFDQALTHFGDLTKAQNAWLRETANYMAGRTLLNKAQVGVFASFDDAESPTVNDKVSLTASEAAMSAYLVAYPTGRYAASARGLMRRIYWLEGDKTRLSAEYGSQVTRWSAGSTNLGRSDLAQEVDVKYLRDAKDLPHDPNLLAAADLVRMRSVTGMQQAAENQPWKRVTTKPNFSAADLEAQAPDFAGHEALFAYLKAARAYYVDGDVAATVQRLGPAQPGPLSPPYLALSREALRGQALMASGQFQLAADHWKALLPLASQPWQKDAVELGLAMNWERVGTLNKVFLPETRVASTMVRAILLRQSAGPILLRMAVANPQSAAERKLARFVLLFKEATRAQYGGFLRDFSADDLVRDDAETPNLDDVKSSDFLRSGANEAYRCPSLRSSIVDLAANPRSSHSLLCLGDFVRLSGLDNFEARRPASDELGGATPIYPGEPFSRLEMYKKLIADPSTPSGDRAYALYRGIYCYARTGNNSCGGKNVDKSQRKAWYDELKGQYGYTPWAQSLQYYW